MPEEAGSSAHNVREVRCVVWHLPSAELKPELRAALARPGFSVLHCEDKFAAMAHLIKLSLNPQPSEFTQTSVGLRAALVVLVLVDPAHLDDAQGLVLAVGRYAPNVVVWMYEDVASPQLRAVRSTDLETWRLSRATATSPHNGPEINVVARQRDIDGAQSPTETSVSRHESSQKESETAGTSAKADQVVPGPNPKRLLNDEELAMLLNVDPPQPEKHAP